MTHRRSLIGWLSALGLVPLVVFGLAFLPTSALRAATDYAVRATVTGIGGSNSIAITPDNKYAVVVGKNDSANRVRVINLATDTFIQSFDIQANTLGMISPRTSSVAISPAANDGTYYAIVTVREELESAVNSGRAVFLNINAATGALTLRGVTSRIAVGVNPESVAIAANGTYALVANEGTRATPGAPATNGTISLIDLRGANPVEVTKITPPSIANPSPETVAIAPDSQRGFVTLQPNNAVAIIDVVVNLSNVLVPTTISQTFPATLRPDGIAVTTDSSYVVTANELGLTQGVSLFQVGEDAGGAATGLTLINTEATPGFTPKTVAIARATGATEDQAFVSLRTGANDTDAVGVFTIAPTGITFDATVPLSPGGLVDVDDPDGIAVANNASVIVTANAPARTVSVIAPFVAPTPTATSEPTATSTTGPTVTPTTEPTVTPTTDPTPTTTTTPTLTPLGWLPWIEK